MGWVQLSQLGPKHMEHVHYQSQRQSIILTPLIDYESLLQIMPCGIIIYPCRVVPSI